MRSGSNARRAPRIHQKVIHDRSSTRAGENETDIRGKQHFTISAPPDGKEEGRLR